MHAGEARNSRDQRAHAAKFPAITVKTIIPAGKWNEKCTPAWRATAAVSGHKGGKFPAITVETTMPAEKRHEKCTPARRAVSRQDDPFPDTLLVFVEINMDRF